MTAETPSESQAELSRSVHLQRRMRDARTRMLYANLPTSLAVNAGVASVTAGLAWLRFPALPVLAWWCAALLLVAMRLLLMKFYATAPTQMAQRAFAIGAFGTGAVWGAASIVFFGAADVQFKLILQMIIAGMAAGGLPVLASVFYIYAGFAALTILPMGIVLLFQDDQRWAAVALLNVIFFLAMIALARRFNGTLNDVLRLRFENELLLGQVLLEKEVVLQTNDRLQQEIETRRQVERDLVEAKETAESANRAKSEFLSSMSHELRTPLNAVMGFSQLLEVNAVKEPLSQSQREAVGHINRAGGHLLGLINQVLDLAKIESGKMPVSISENSVESLVEESVELVSVAMQRRNIQLHLMVDPEAKVLADRMHLKQVLLNLLSNAIKYNREGGKLTVRSCDGTAGSLRLEVEDQGEGIPADRIRQVFEPFNRLGAERSNIEGAGVGLAVTMQLIKMMNGQIGCDSLLGTGSTFWIELPRAPSANPV